MTGTLHPADALNQWRGERDALVKCARALSFTYGGSKRPDPADPEGLALWEAMYAAYDALGVADTRQLPGPGGGHAVAGS